jgi:hypothetical protein
VQQLIFLSGVFIAALVSQQDEAESREFAYSP